MKKETTFSAVIWSKRSKRYVSLTLIFSLLLGNVRKGGIWNRVHLIINSNIS